MPRDAPWAHTHFNKVLARRSSSRNHKDVAAPALLVAIPVAVKEVVEHNGLDLRSFRLFQPPDIAGFFNIWRIITFGIHLGGKENVLAIRRPQFATSLGDNRGLLLYCSN